MILRILSIALFLGFFASNGNAQLQVDGDQFSIEITNETSRTQLLDLRNELLEMNVDFRYRGVDWNNEGEMMRIHVMLTTEQGSEGEYKIEQFQDGMSLVITRNITGGQETLYVGPAL